MRIRRPTNQLLDRKAPNAGPPRSQGLHHLIIGGVIPLFLLLLFTPVIILSLILHRSLVIRDSTNFGEDHLALFALGLGLLLLLLRINPILLAEAQPAGLLDCRNMGLCTRAVVEKTETMVLATDNDIKVQDLRSPK